MASILIEAAAIAVLFVLVVASAFYEVGGVALRVALMGIGSALLVHVGVAAGEDAPPQLHP